MFTKIVHHCHKVLFHQINAWIVHGQLIDIFDEFFIHRIDKAGEEVKEDDLNKTTVSKKTDLNKTNLSVGSRLNATVGVIKLRNALGLEDEEKEWNNSYTLRMAMLPQQGPISGSLAEKILFIGKAVKVLQSRKTNEEDRITIQDLQSFSSAISKVAGMKEFNGPLFSKVIETIGDFVSKKLWILID